MNHQLGIRGGGAKGTPGERPQLCPGGQAGQMDKAGDNPSRRELHVQGHSVMEMDGRLLGEQRARKAGEQGGGKKERL